MAASLVHLPSATTRQRTKWMRDLQPQRLLQQLACVAPRWRLHARPPLLQRRSQSVSTPQRPEAPSPADRVSSQLEFEIKEAAAVLRDLQAASTWEAKVVIVRVCKFLLLSWQLMTISGQAHCSVACSVRPFWRGNKFAAPCSPTGAFCIMLCPCATDSTAERYASRLDLCLSPTRIGPTVSSAVIGSMQLTAAERCMILLLPALGQGHVLADTGALMPPWFAIKLLVVGLLLHDITAIRLMRHA